MQKAFLSTCLLLASLSPVTSLTCTYCPSNETSCEGDTAEVCNSTAICASGALDTNIVPTYKMTTYRGCTDSKGCHAGDYSISSVNGKYLQMKIDCCGIDNCNKEPYSVIPRKDVPPNGLECAACFDVTEYLNVNKCKNQGTVSCLGNETKCIELFIGAKYFSSTKKMKLRGCATEDVCSLNGKKFTIGNLKILKIITQCSDAKKSSKQIDSQ